MAPARKLRLSVQTKVLIPVLAFLILMPLILLWIVSGEIKRQVLSDGHQTLQTADGVFRQVLESRSKELTGRVIGAAQGDSRYLSIAQVAAAGPSDRADATLRSFLDEQRLQDYGDDCAAIFFTYAGSQRSVGAVRDGQIPLAEFAAASKALHTEPTADVARGMVTVSGGVYFVTSVGLQSPDSGVRVGTLTVAVRLSDAAIQELNRLARTEILFVSHETLLISSAQNLDRDQVSAISSDPAGQSELQVVNGEHYLRLKGDFDHGTDSPQRLQYVLLLSLEASLRNLADTIRALAAVSLLGVLISALVVWFLVKRFIHPLRELADSAEAVGRGDFTRRIEVASNDECGDLANAFNGMTANLQSSRAELETAVDTLKSTQAQLIQSEKLSAVGQFVAGVAHELNNPLTAVIGFSDLLSKTSTDAKIIPHLELISKSALRCHKIVQNLLGFARQHPPERKLVHVNASIESVLEIMAYDFRTSNISIIRDLKASLPPTLGDAHQLQQVFVNILGNARQAIQAVRQDGQIIVRTFTDGKTITVEFADNGPGIRPENLPKIFDPFFTTKAVGKGTGLGLSLSYGIIKEHGGRITVQSIHGQGATFTIELPVVDGTSVVPATLEHRPARPLVTASSGKKILIVDDEEWILTLGTELLTNEGHAVTTAAGGEHAVQTMRTQLFDVIVSDWKMPGMNGIQLYEHLKASRPQMADRMIFMTGDVVSEAFTEFLERNKKACIPKPFAIEDFQEAVSRMLGDS